MGILAGNLDGGVLLLLFPPYFLGAMVLDLVVFVVVVSFFLVEDLVDGVVVGAMKRQGKEGEFRSNLHRGGSANIIELSDFEELTAIKAAKALGLGVAGVDMLQSSKGPLVLEVNSSPGLEGIETATKKDIAKEIIKYIERNV